MVADPEEAGVRTLDLMADLMNVRDDLCASLPQAEAIHKWRMSKKTEHVTPNFGSTASIEGRV